MRETGLNSVKTSVFAIATIAIAARITSKLWLGIGPVLVIPDTAYSVVGGATLAGAIMGGIA